MQVLREERNGERVDGKLKLVGGEAAGQLGRVTRGKDLFSWEAGALK